MRGGIWVLAIMAAVWGVAAVLVGGQPQWLAIVPVALSAALLLWARRQTLTTGSVGGGDHVGRVVGIASAVEGVAIFLAANFLVHLHQPTLVMPAIAIIVGLHFLPLARWIPLRLYYGTAAALIAVGVIAWLLPPLNRALFTGVLAAVVLWVSCVALVRGGRR